MHGAHSRAAIIVNRRRGRKGAQQFPLTTPLNHATFTCVWEQPSLSLIPSHASFFILHWATLPKISVRFYIRKFNELENKISRKNIRKICASQKVFSFSIGYTIVVAGSCAHLFLAKTRAHCEFIVLFTCKLATLAATTRCKCALWSMADSEAAPRPSPHPTPLTDKLVVKRLKV